MTSAAGVPSRSVMSSSWCTTLRPGKSGLPSRISAKMQPMLQMSIIGLYLAKKDPHSSGARYHLQEHTHRQKASSRATSQDAAQAAAHDLELYQMPACCLLAADKLLSWCKLGDSAARAAEAAVF